MKKEPCLRLDEIASALSQADQARMAPELSPADRVIMEQACVTLREAERTAIVNVETGLVERFTQNASSVNLQAMTKAQLKRVNDLAVVSDSSMTGPGTVLKLLDEVRLERGLIYAADASPCSNPSAEPTPPSSKRWTTTPPTASSWMNSSNSTNR